MKTKHRKAAPVAAKSTENSHRNARKRIARHAAVNKDRKELLGLITGFVPVLDLNGYGGPAFKRVIHDVPATSRLDWDDADRAIGRKPKARTVSAIEAAFNQAIKSNR